MNKYRDEWMCLTIVHPSLVCSVCPVNAGGREPIVPTCNSLKEMPIAVALATSS